MYVSPNCKTKKELKDRVASGARVEIFSPGPFPAPREGTATVEGPHYPAPHKWAARVEIKDGLVTRVL